MITVKEYDVKYMYYIGTIANISEINYNRGGGSKEGEELTKI